MPISLSEAFRSGNRPKPKPRAAARATPAAAVVSRLVKPAVRRLRLRSKLPADRVALAEYFRQRPTRSAAFWRAKNQQRAEVRAAAAAVSGLECHSGRTQEAVLSLRRLKSQILTEA